MISILLIFLFIFLSPKSKPKTLSKQSNQSNCSKEEEINDIKSCQTSISLKGTCNNIIKKFFEDENITYSDQYLDNPNYIYPAFIMS